MRTSAVEPSPVSEVVQAVKPRLRGWLHAGAAPLALAAGIVLVVLVVWLRSRKREDVEEEYEPLELGDDVLAELERLRVASSRDEIRPVKDNKQLELEAAERQRVRGEISTMVSERPDEVAAMLRGWLTENKA